jgi:hypothetical protein
MVLKEDLAYPTVGESADCRGISKPGDLKLECLGKAAVRQSIARRYVWRYTRHCNCSIDDNWPQSGAIRSWGRSFDG